ncbi:DUF3558 domain-containing protein [Lentzea flava]|uniref:DUF3558 domain-containing protein n=1 Tax=Lentzea flava TaxID=103732 RepID=A0ABQ2UKR7_9PSEU|nr:DUF3558 domain-containing protein [Lentzea flava]MCP2200428.1 Protein of unknown function (DUF3558) [Lentzea flava]GGU42653.1 hypothetical protein GCM10010178_39060 [Lentzea flava]
MKRITALLTAVLTIGVLAGCSEKTPGNANTTAPTTADQTSTAPTSGGSSSGLSIAKFVSKPCDILTAAQVAKLGQVKAPQPGTTVLGPECVWKGQDVIKNSTYTVVITEDKSVEEMVAQLKSSPIFTDKKVADVRVIVNDSTDGVMHCRALIEVSKTDSVTLDASIAKDERPTKPACNEVESFAAMVIENLRG